MTKNDVNIKIILGDKMKSKEKIILGIILILILAIIYISILIYSNKNVSYASNAQISNKSVEISNAEKVDVEQIIAQNQKNVLLNMS